MLRYNEDFIKTIHIIIFNIQHFKQRNQIQKLIITGTELLTEKVLE